MNLLRIRISSTFLPYLIGLAGGVTDVRADFNPAPYVWPHLFSQGTPFYAAFDRADMDQDGREDIVSIYSPQPIPGRNSIGFFWSRGLQGKSLEEGPLALPQRMTPQILNSRRIADLDGDGYPDLLGAIARHPEGDELLWMRNLYGETGTVSFDTTPRLIHVSPPLQNDIQVVFAADMDADGDIDPITCVDWGSEKFYIHANRLNEPAADFAAPVLLFDKGRYVFRETVAFHDVDADGDTDVATTLMLSGGKETIVWLENKIIDVSALTLSLHGNLASPQGLPTNAAQATLAIARVGGSLWLRFLKPGQAPVTITEADMPEEAAAFAKLSGQLDTNWTISPASFAATLIKRQATRICRYRTGILQLQMHEIFTGFSNQRYYSPDQILFGDLDGDGDSDFYTGHSDPFDGPTNGWFENRLNEAAHADIATFQKLDLENYGGGAILSDLDGDRIPEILYRTQDSGIRVVHDTPGLLDAGTIWTEQVRSQATESSSASSTGYFVPIDLDGDGDKDIVSDLVDYQGSYHLISENWGSSRKDRFRRYETPLVTGLSRYDSFYLRSTDADGDGDPDLALSKTKFYRNDYSTTPGSPFVADSSFSEFPVPPAPDPAVIAAFETWRTTRPWSRTGNLLRNLTADVDGDGDQDVIAFHGVHYADTSVSWFENRSSTEAPDFRGPFGITGNVPLDAPLVVIDYDSDGDPDVLTLLYKVVTGVMERRLVVFENESEGPGWFRSLVNDREGYFRHALARPGFTATLQCSPTLNWGTAQNIPVPLSALKKPAEMKQLMGWADPAHPKRFYRMIYTLPESDP